MQAPSVLFVCLGNICRSPLAEGALRAAAAARGVEVTVESAGIGGWHAGAPPDPRAQAVADAHGVDISGLRARRVVADDFARFGHVVAMDRDNLAALLRMRPERGAGAPAARVSLLLDHVPGRAGQAVADPYYAGPEGFVATWAAVTAGAAGLLDHLQRGL